MMINRRPSRELERKVQRLAAWLNKRPFTQPPSHYIELLGGRFLGETDKMPRSRFYIFGDEGNAILLCEINGRFLDQEHIASAIEFYDTEG